MDFEGLCCTPLPEEHSSASGCTKTEALHYSAAKCKHYCYAADEHQHNMTVQDIQENGNRVQKLPKLDIWWLFAIFEFAFGCHVHNQFVRAFAGAGSCLRCVEAAYSVAAVVMLQTMRNCILT